MIYRYFEIGKKMREIVSDKPLEEEEVHNLIGEEISFVLLKNGNTLCVDAEGVIKQLPYNRAFTEKDTEVDLGYGLRGNILEGKVDTNGDFVGVK